MRDFLLEKFIPGSIAAFLIFFVVAPSDTVYTTTLKIVHLVLGRFY